MAKNETEEQRQDDVEVEINLPGTAAADFGDDELGQIRTLLFGKHARQTLERVERVERELLAAIDELTANVDRRLNQLDGRLDNENHARLSAETNLDTRLEEETRARRDGQIDLRTDLDRRSAEIRQQLGSARDELATRIESVDTDLRERNVDREALAHLFERAATNLSSADE